VKFEILSETLSTLRRHGFEPRVEQSKHFKIHFVDASGRPRCVIVSCTPSSRNAIHRARSMLRRLLEGRARP
jgi:hypothetical protein